MAVGATPLHMAVAVLDRGIEGKPERARRRVKTLKEFLRLGANPALGEFRGRDAIAHRAQEDYDVEILKLLLKYGANPDVAGKDGRTVREIASRKRDKKYFEALGTTK